MTEPATAALRADVLAGLARPRKTLPCKWLYDQVGAEVFERITELPEYYLTRREREILEENGAAIARAIGPGAAVVELGPGDGLKAIQLLGALEAPAAYVPVDIAAEWLDAATSRVAAAFPKLPVQPVVADFTADFRLPAALPGARRLGFFPGSTIGNFPRAEAAAFLRRQRQALGKGALFLVGADLVKEIAVLEAAYDDAAGVTAAFNLNLLRRINRELGADFEPEAFRHRAIWNAAKACIEMHLVSLRAQAVTVAGRRFAFEAGESIHTEDSHKYRIEGFRDLAAEGGWDEVALWTDARQDFSVWLLRAA